MYLLIAEAKKLGNLVFQSRGRGRQGKKGKQTEGEYLLLERKKRVSETSLSKRGKGVLRCKWKSRCRKNNLLVAA